MGDSNGAWGDLARHDDELAEVFDQFDRLPDPGENDALDAFVERKHVDIASLVRVGARLASYDQLAFGFPGGIKFRDIITDKRWSYMGSTWHDLKVVRSGLEPARCVIVAEGETDAARLTMLYPGADVAVLPAGADPRPHTEAYAELLNRYELVLLGQDPDQAGDAGAALLAEHLTTRTKRFVSGEDDWASLEGDPPPLPSPEDVDVPVAQRVLVSTRDFLGVEPPDILSYFDQAILPVGGQLILHGALKSFKSFQAIDLAAALAQSQPWCGFEPTDEPIKVAIMQYEIPWPYYRQRLEMLVAGAAEPELLMENLVHWAPFSRPRLVAGNTASEDGVLRELEAAGVTAFVLDPIRRAVGMAKINDEDGARPMLHFFQRLQDQGITVITTHHDNKDSVRSGGGDPTGMTGSGAWGGDADTIVSVALPKGRALEDPERNLHFLLRNAPSPSTRSMRMGEDGVIRYELRALGDEEAEPTAGSEAPPI